MLINTICLAIASALVIFIAVYCALVAASRSDDEWRAYDDGDITVICARCHKHLRGRIPEPGRTISHGLCTACATAQMQSDLETVTRLRSPSPQVGRAVPSAPPPPSPQVGRAVPSAPPPIPLKP